PRGWPRAAAAAVACVALGLAVYGLASFNFGPFFLCVIAEAIILARARHRLEAVLADRGANGAGLRLFAGVLALVPPPDGARADAVQALRRLAHLSDWMDVCGSMLGRILDFTVLHSLQLGFAAEAWRRRHGAQLAAWLDAVAEFEALLSLSAYAFERPAEPFPQVAAAPAPGFCAEALGHPLLPAGVCVRNRIELDASTRILLVSGSNMSGKSTLLRTVGLNAVLAQMGAPVRAASLRMSPLAIGTRLRTADSLQLGRSGFYAEILRLRQIVALAHEELPLLFLFDELLEGTNSHDRVEGGNGLMRALLDQPTLGLITTHDLALTRLAEADPRVRNVHFEDQIEGQDVRFDHRLRPGVVTRSNALALMRIIGLEV
ncbi:MAG: MutS-related protein, partial [Terriglobales bacterium]